MQKEIAEKNNPLNQDYPSILQTAEIEGRQIKVDFAIERPEHERPAHEQTDGDDDM